MGEHGQTYAEPGERAQAPEPRLRLFVGVPLPEGLLARALGAQAALPRLPGLRLLLPEQLHVTLAFIGEVGAAAAADAAAVVAGVPRHMGGTACLADNLVLPNARRARVVALAIDDSAGVFSGLHERVMFGLEKAGVLRREARPFRPHLTIARLSKPTTLQPKAQCERTPYPVSSVCLYRSELSSAGARYSVLTRTVLETDNGFEV